MVSGYCLNFLSKTSDQKGCSCNYSTRCVDRQVRYTSITAHMHLPIGYSPTLQIVTRTSRCPLCRRTKFQRRSRQIPTALQQKTGKRRIERRHRSRWLRCSCYSNTPLTSSDLSSCEAFPLLSRGFRERASAESRGFNRGRRREP